MISIAKKGAPANIGLYIFSFLLGTVLLVNGFVTDNGYIMIIIGVILLLIPIIRIIRFKKIPEDIIKYNEINNTILIKEKYLVNLSRITDIYYAKYFDGIIIKTKYEIYRCTPILDSKDCYDKLIELRYKKLRG